MIPRILEPEAMETPEEVLEYDAMDHSEVNRAFVRDFLRLHGPARGGEILDVGSGTARIPITLVQADANARVLALDLSANMLARAAENIAAAGLARSVRCLLADVKRLDPTIGGVRFEAVISNTIVHHIPDPVAALRAMLQRVAPGGTLMVRDLARPDTAAELQRLVQVHAGGESPAAQALFAASLHAALTLEEIRQIALELGLSAEAVAMTSDRHWTLGWRRPA